MVIERLIELLTSENCAGEMRTYEMDRDVKGVSMRWAHLRSMTGKVRDKFYLLQ